MEYTRQQIWFQTLAGWFYFILEYHQKRNISKFNKELWLQKIFKTTKIAVFMYSQPRTNNLDVIGMTSLSNLKSTGGFLSTETIKSNLNFSELFVFHEMLNFQEKQDLSENFSLKFCP